ncbi:MAG: zinc ribbon domain-containing protein [Leptolinea sp.]
MAQKKVGYVELEWICPNCKTRNPGLSKTCQSCGSPQPADVEFESKADEQLIEDEAKFKQAEKGADIHCGFCGARNPADAVTCSQCGGDIKEGKQRAAGKVLGGFQATEGSITLCPNCKTDNPANAQICSKCGAPLNASVKPAEIAKKGFSLGCIIGIVVAVLAVIGLIILLSIGGQKKGLEGTLSGATWERIIEVQLFGPVQKDDWKDKVPTNAKIGQCTDRSRSFSDKPVPNSKEVCGDPYKVDKGNGVAEVVQDCKYEVFDSYCEYSVDEWHTGDSLKAAGSGVGVVWPDTNLGPQQREGDRTENYSLHFSVDGKDYTYQTSDYSLYQQATPGSRWKITVNGFGSIVSIEPAN